jgi:hypothetical protein
LSFAQIPCLTNLAPIVTQFPPAVNGSHIFKTRYDATLTLAD